MNGVSRRTAARPRRSAAGFMVSVIMPTTSWDGTFGVCARRVCERIDAARFPVEFIVVFDGVMPAPPDWLLRPEVRVVATGRVLGPAAARNRGSEAAEGTILFFVDADVELGDRSLGIVCSRLTAENAPTAMFGSYDDAPAAPGTVSLFRNLLHHHTHRSHPGAAGTFWAGCGAVRAAFFEDVGGFDEAFRRPSVEDIDLGMRIVANGGTVVLDPALEGKHHKRWTMWSMVRTDIVHRAVPWSRIIAASGRLPATLNLGWRSRISGAAAVASVAAALATPFFSPAVWLAGAGVSVVVALNLAFYRLCGQRGGVAFATASCGLHFLFFFYSTVTFGLVILWSLVLHPPLRSAWKALIRPATRTASLPPA